jgi:hypothetical protein
MLCRNETLRKQTKRQGDRDGRQTKRQGDRDGRYTRRALGPAIPPQYFCALGIKHADRPKGGPLVSRERAGREKLGDYSLQSWTIEAAAQSSHHA